MNTRKVAVLLAKAFAMGVAAVIVVLFGVGLIVVTFPYSLVLLLIIGVGAAVELIISSWQDRVPFDWSKK